MDNNLAAEGVASETAATEEALAPQEQKKKRHVNQQKLQDNLWGWAFILPLLVGTVLFVYIALILAVMLSFTSYRTGSSTSLFEVIGNLGDWIIKYDDSTAAMAEATQGGAFHWYLEIFTEIGYSSATLYTTKGFCMNEVGAYLFNTVFYMIGIPIGMVLAVFFAVCMSRDIKGGNAFKVIYYLPCVSSSVAIVYTFKMLFKEAGVINQLLGLYDAETGSGFVWITLGTGTPSTWASLTGNTTATSMFMLDPYWCQGILSKCVIIVMSVWKGLGGTIILYVAGLSGVNAATKEAAQIDGANGWQIFWKITMPDLYPVIFYNIVTSVIGGLQIYAEPELLMGGESILTSGYVSLIYRYGITNKYAGQGSAYGIFLGLIILVLTLFQFYLDGKNKE